MRRRILSLILFSILSLSFGLSFYLHILRDYFSANKIHSATSILRYEETTYINKLVEEFRSVEVSLPSKFQTSILFPDWEVIVFSNRLQLESNVENNLFCRFQNGRTSEAIFIGRFQKEGISEDPRILFSCVLPRSVRRVRPFYGPVLTVNPGNFSSSFPLTNKDKMLRWTSLVYDTLSTKNDVVVFAKGINNRQGVNVPPSKLSCVFSNGIQTAVTSSSQEVFRCRHPIPSLPPINKLKISLAVNNSRVLPSVAYYTPRRKIANSQEKSLLCACTMVYNVAKFLKEWVIYHSKIGVEKFILYDNQSEDGLERTVRDLAQHYNVSLILWPWPKTQEAGFSHCAVHARDSCTWMMFTDVDEFVFSSSWTDSSHPSSSMLPSLLPSSSLSSPSNIGQVMFRCFEFGPSDQRAHPIHGVTQGYTCRRKDEQRHKSIVLLEAIDFSLNNVVHHFRLKEGFTSKRLKRKEGLLNHYKYQAWPEFKLKFRRRVSAYVVDWKQGVNPGSKDRTPGLGFEPVEPDGWAQRFCEVRDTELMVVSRRWFLSEEGDGKMIWEGK